MGANGSSLDILVTRVSVISAFQDQNMVFDKSVELHTSAFL